MIAWVASKRYQWRKMSPNEKASAILNLLLDAALWVFFVLMVIVAATRNSNAYVFWVPFLLFVGFKRYQQAGHRWAAARRP